MIKYLEKDFKEEIKDREILIDFYADWCGPCRMLGEVLLDIENELNVDILKVDIDKFPEIAKEYSVMSIPKLVLVNNGNISKSKMGYMSKEELLKFVQEK